MTKAIFFNFSAAAAFVASAAWSYAHLPLLSTICTGAGVLFVSCAWYASKRGE